MKITSVLTFILTAFGWVASAQSGTNPGPDRIVEYKKIGDIVLNLL